MCIYVILLIGSRAHITVSRNGRDYSIYINGRFTAHAVSSADIVYQNAFLVFGVDYRNRSNFFEGTMDHIAIYSQSLSGSEIKSLYSSEVDAPSSIPTLAPSNYGSFQTAASGSSGNADELSVTTIIQIVCAIIGAIVGIAVCAKCRPQWKKWIG